MNFLGSTTPSTVLGSVTTGVQSTGSDLWPLVILIGVPLAFWIGIEVVDFIRKAVRPNTNPLESDEATIAHDSWLKRVENDLDTTGHSRL